MSESWSMSEWTEFLHHFQGQQKFFSSIVKLYGYDKKLNELQHDKSNKMTCAQRRLWSAWASAQSDQSLLSAQRVAKDPSFHHADSEDWRLGGCLGWSESSLGLQVILLVLSCTGSNGLARMFMFSPTCRTITIHDTHPSHLILVNLVFENLWAFCLLKTRGPLVLYCSPECWVLVLEYVMLYTKFQGHWPFYSREKYLLWFLPYMGMVAIFVMWPGSFETAFVPPSQGGSTWNLASIGLVVIVEKKFKNIESERFGPRSINDLDLCTHKAIHSFS